MQDLLYLTNLYNHGLVYQEDRLRIWNLYKEIFGINPNGKISCSNCILTSIEQLYKHLILKHL